MPCVSLEFAMHSYDLLNDLLYTKSPQCHLIVMATLTFKVWADAFTVLMTTSACGYSFCNCGIQRLRHSTLNGLSAVVQKVCVICRLCLPKRLAFFTREASRMCRQRVTIATASVVITGTYDVLTDTSAPLVL